MVTTLETIDVPLVNAAIPGGIPMPSSTLASQPSTHPATPLPIRLPNRHSSTVEPGIPVIVDELYFGVPAGNGIQPDQIAVDSQRQRVYTLNDGISALKEGNTISVLDLDKGEITALIHLDNMQEEDSYPPAPLDLQVDPYRPRLYALWGDRFADGTDDTLMTIIDTNTLAVVDTLTGVEAVAPGPDRLYLANDIRLWAVDPDSLAELKARDLDPSKLSGPLLLNPQADRLYLGRGYPWSLEIFKAGSLVPVDSYSVAAESLRAVVDVDGERLFILENDGKQIVLHALDADGHPLADPTPVPITDRTYSDPPLVFDGQTLYVVEDEYMAYQLHAFALPDLTLLDSLPLANLPDDLVVDPVAGLLYAAYDWPISYVLTIAPSTGLTEAAYTALTVTDALADPDRDRLYVLDNGGTLRVLSLTDYDEIARLETGFNLLGDYRDSYGQLSLDPGRNRLYINGDPVWVVDTDSLQVMSHLNGRGQVTPDPTGDRIYLTPPCSCRVEQCNTLILSADTLTGTKTLFPPEDPFTAPCVVATRLDADNQLLYARIYNGVPGSNSGDYFSVFDVSDLPAELYTAFDISYGDVALDPPHQRAFAPRYRINRSFIHRFEAQGGTITQTLELVGAHGQLAYDSLYDLLYAVQYDGALQVFDGDLALLAEITLPGEFDLLTFDSQGQRLYLGGPNGNVLVVATGGGQLEPPPPASLTTDQPQTQQLLTAPDGTLFRVYDLRLYRSDDDGQTWDLLGQGLPGRPVGALAISPDYEGDQMLLVGLWGYGRGGGLYRSTDGGDTWHPTTRGLTDMEISEIVFSPAYARDQTIFVTTFDHGLFRTTDGGDTWTSLADRYADDAYDYEVVHLALSPTLADDGLVIISKRHLLRSTDGGDTWVDTRVPGGLVVFSPDFANDGLILSSGCWRSTDGGQTWQPAAVGLEPGVVENLFFSPQFAADQTAYLLLRRDYDDLLSLQRSVDAGRSWDSLVGGLPAGFEIASAVPLPTGELYLTALDGRQLTTPAEALEWGGRRIDMTQPDWQDLAVADDGTLFLANSSAGVFKSVDGGRTWVETDFFARANPVWHPARLAIANAHRSPAGHGTLFGAAGSAIGRSTDGGQTWTYLSGVPPGFEIASLSVSPDFAEDGIVLAGGNYTNCQIIRSADGGETWEVVFDGATIEIEYASDVSAIAFSPNFAKGNGTLYAWLRDGGLLRSTDSGRSWSLVVSEGSGYYVQSLAVSPAGDGLYVGALDGHVLVSEDEGQHWLDLKDNIPDDRVWSTTLAFSPDGTLFLGADKGAYRTLDGGQTWTRASAGLPLRSDEGMPQAVRVLRFSDDRLYAALTQGGLFVSDDQGRSWRSTVTGQPASPIEALLPTPAPTARSSGVTQTPTPEPPLSPSDCSNSPRYFTDLWAGRVAQLGCPVIGGGMGGVPIVEQTFEGGWMFWRSDTAAIYVFPSGQPYARYDDTWDESQPTYSCPDLFPSQTPPTPHRGFGKVWCNEPLVRKLLGNATSGERLFDAVLQEFETGLIFKTDQEVTYILESRLSDWERVE